MPNQKDIDEAALAMVAGMARVLELKAEADTLRAEVARLRAALMVMAQGRKTEDAMGGDYGFILDRYIDVARAALAHGEADQ
jgi:hypothetical protein